MLHPHQQTIPDALHEETTPLILLRMRRLLYIGIIGLLLSALSDFRLGPSIPRDLILLKLAGALLQGVGVVLVTLARPFGWRWSTTIAVVAWSLPCLVVSVNGSYTADPIMPALLLPLMVVGAGLVFSWGTRPQLALVAVAGAIFLPHVAALGTNLAVSVYSIFAASVYVASTFERQQRERKAIELLQAGQQRVLERIAADAALDTIFQEQLDTIVQQVPALMCSLMLLDSGTKQLRYATSVGLPDGYRAAIDAFGFGPGTSTGCCAAAARSGTRAIAADIATDPRWEDVRPVVLSLGLRSSWSEPILSAERSVLGIVTVYGREPHIPDAGEIQRIEGAARLLGIAIERRQAREDLERYLQAIDAARVQAERQAQRLQEQAVELAEARDQALASVRARSQFLANMSHEIRTPLNGIIGTTESLLESDLNPAQREQTQILLRCGEHLLSVINDILDLSKIEAGKVGVEHVELDLRVLVEEVADVLAAAAQGKGVELVSSIPPQFDAMVKGDPSRLRQVLVNLVGNAVKFTERGEVTIEVREISSSATHRTVRLAVRDTGIGIPPGRQGAIFESFTQGDGSTTRTHGGTGLGLTISRELVGLMGGVIGLQSTPGQGSAFWIDVPFERSALATALPQPAAQFAHLHVLVVDDNATNRSMLRQSLQSWGCRVEEAVNGADALARLEGAVSRERFALVILDMRMRDLDGIETARHIQANPLLARVPLILLSSIGGLRDDAGEAQALRLAAVVSKPVHRAALFDAVLAAVGGAVVETGRRRSPAAPARQALALRVLLVEDNRVNQLVARRLLDKLSCHTDIVENGREAVAAVALTRYDVILMDIQMPIMDGIEATGQIRRSEAVGEHLPIIAMTAHAMQGDRERCLAAGMDGYVTKPVSFVALGDVLAGVQPRNSDHRAALVHLGQGAERSEHASTEH